MQSELINHLEKVGEYQVKDFRWSNIRKLVKRYICGKKILDAGCGTGHLSLDLLKEGYNVTAVDGSREMVSYARKKIFMYYPDAKVIECDLTNINPTQFPLFDTIISLDVIERTLGGNECYETQF